MGQPLCFDEQFFFKFYFYMEVKKSPKANREGKKAVFTQIGLVWFLVLCLLLLNGHGPITT